MAAPLNAIDAITPAWTRALDLLIRPFRWAFWWRMAFLAFMTGEVSGGNFNIPTDWNTRSKSGHDFLAAASPFSGIAPGVIAGAVVAVLIVGIIFMYLGCVFRFVQFDAILTGRYRLREGFERWQAHGTRFFWWSLGFLLVVVACGGLIVLLIVGGMAMMKGAAGAGGILLIVIGALIGIAALVAAALVFVLTKDFVIPIMAFDGVGAMDGWGTLRRMIAADPLSYLAYIGMKIVLGIGAGFAMMMVMLLLLVFIALPAGIVIALLVAGLHSASTALAIAFAVVVGLVALVVLFFLMGLLAVPAATFFQAYAIQFFARRFRPMELVMYPEAAAPVAPVAPPVLSPEPGPAPA
ncbi:MAG: hypothetical protein M3P27_05645 [Acidobacteriota bacterium]|nr:hypothetical protein [Acidobacteriota bacterium]